MKRAESRLNPLLNVIEEDTIINNLTAENWGFFFDALTQRYLVDTVFNEVKNDLKNILS